MLPRYKRLNCLILSLTSHGLLHLTTCFLMKMKLIGLEFVDRKRQQFISATISLGLIFRVVTRYTHTVTLSKKEATYIPFIGVLIKFAGPVIVDRDDTSSRLKVVKEIIALLKQGYSLTLFPEGTRTKDGKLMEPNNAMVKLCYKLNIPVVAAALEGTRDVLPRNRFYVKCFQKVVLKFNSPLYPKDFKNEEEFSVSCWKKVVDTHNEILENYFPEKNNLYFS